MMEYVNKGVLGGMCLILAHKRMTQFVTYTKEKSVAINDSRYAIYIF